MKVPDYYRRHNIQHWSHSKLSSPMQIFVAEWMWRQPLFFAAKRDAARGDAEAEMRASHYDRPRVVQMLAGTAVHAAAFSIFNGEEDAAAATRHAVSRCQSHEPPAWNERDKKLTDHLLSEDASRVVATIEHAADGLREACVGANRVETEEEMWLELPGIEVPVKGYLDGRTSKLIVELKTKWDTVYSRSKAGFRSNSLPKSLDAVPADHIAQVALYQRMATGDEACRLVYANRGGYVVHEVEQDRLNEAIDQSLVTLRRRQRLLERNETFQDVCDSLDVDFSHWRWRDWPPQLLEEAKAALAGDESAVPAGWRTSA